MQDHRQRLNSTKGMIMQVLPKLNTAPSLIFFTLLGLGTQFLVIRPCTRQTICLPQKLALANIALSYKIYGFCAINIISILSGR